MLWSLLTMYVLLYYGLLFPFITMASLISSHHHVLTLFIVTSLCPGYPNDYDS